MPYKIKTVSGLPDWDNIQKAALSRCKWSPYRAPDAEFQAVCIKNSRLLFKLTSHSLPARAENRSPDSRVWEDSCLECFLSFDGKRYMNLEANANSAMRAGFGSCRHDRQLLLSMGIPMPKAEAVIYDSGWSVTFDIPSETVEALFSVTLHTALDFYGNFYSCGDKTPEPYYSSWSRIDSEQPDFHRPEYFGRLVIV